MPVIIVLLLVLELAFGCARQEKSDVRVAEPTETIIEAQARVSSFIDEYGFIVSRNAQDGPEHIGDSLLWSGIALGLLPCESAAHIEAALVDMIESTAGHLHRHPTDLTESDDGKWGVYWGLKRYLKSCGSTNDWVALLNSHRALTATNLHPMIDDILHDLGARDNLTDATRGTVGVIVSNWAALDVLQMESGFRIHLGFLIMDQIGSKEGKAAFCNSAVNAGMELIIAYCGNPEPLQNFTRTFRPNLWEYKLQRSPFWELTPDGAGLQTPGLDLLMAEDFLAR